jgi:hypothetical protein
MATCYLLLVVSLMFHSPIGASAGNVSIDWNIGANNSTCWSNSIPCKTLDYALAYAATNNTIINVARGLQYLENDIEISNISNLTITGVDDSTIHCSHNNTGIKFVSMINLSIYSITLSGCGSLHFSIAQPFGEDMIKFKSALYILNSTNVSIRFTTIKNSSGVGLVMYDTNGIVLIDNSHFINNKMAVNEIEHYPGGGGIYIEFTTCTPGLTACRFNQNPYTSSNTYYIIDCTFINNTATLGPNNTLTYVKRNGPVIRDFGRGGGLSISLKGRASNNSITIEGCYFADNIAEVGGGLAMLVDLNQAHRNYINIIGSNFSNNLATHGGGGVQFGFFNTFKSESSNEIVFTNVHFVMNNASYGGGLALFSSFIPHGVLLLHINAVSFIGCSWRENIANVGAAVLLFPEDWSSISQGYLFRPLFEDCNFINNRVKFLNVDERSYSFDSKSKKTIIGGIIDINTFSVDFKSSIVIDNNRGSGIHLLAGELHILTNTNVTISSNIASRGAGISLLGFGAIVAHTNSNLTFLNNIAFEKGGAIFYYTSDSLDFINSRRCFIRYQKILPPNEWNATFAFINNSAGNYGKSIYAVTLEPCARAGLTNGSNFDVKSVFHWKPFYFVPNLNTPHVITTSVSELDLYESHINAAPGLIYQINVTAKDDLEQVVDTILMTDTLPIIGQDKVASDFQYISNHGNISFIGNHGDNFSLLLQVVGSNEAVGVSIEASVGLQYCPPGYIFSTDTKTCICSAYSSKPIPGIVACNETVSKGIMKVGYWAGCSYDAGELLTAQCPLGYCNYADKINGMINLPKKCSQLETSLCTDNRKGVLCGSCRANYSAYYHSSRFQCNECTYAWLGWLFYILSELVPMTLLFLLVIFFDISFTSGSVNSLLFFAQVLDFFQVTAFGSYNLPVYLEILTTIYQFIFATFNMEFFRLDSLSFCLGKELLYWTYSHSNM